MMVARHDTFTLTGKGLTLIVTIVSLVGTLFSAAGGYYSTRYAVQHELDDRPVRREVRQADSLISVRIDSLRTIVVDLRSGQNRIEGSIDLTNDRLRQLICDALRASESACRLVR